MCSIDVFKSNLGGYEQDQLEVLSILEKYGLKSLFAFYVEKGRSVPIRFHPRNDRSVLSYRTVPSFTSTVNLSSLSSAVIEKLSSFGNHFVKEKKVNCRIEYEASAKRLEIRLSQSTGNLVRIS